MMRFEAVRLLLSTFIMVYLYLFGAVRAADEVGKRFAYAGDHEFPVAYATVDDAELPLLIDSCTSWSFVFEFYADRVHLKAPR
jgi:hypothetical protein